MPIDGTTEVVPFPIRLGRLVVCTAVWSDKVTFVTMGDEMILSQ